MLDLYKVVGTSIPGEGGGTIINNARLSVSPTEYYPGCQRPQFDEGSSAIYLVTEDPEGLKFPYYDLTGVKQAFFPGVTSITPNPALNVNGLAPNTNYTVYANRLGDGISIAAWTDSRANTSPRGTNTFSFGPYEPEPPGASTEDSVVPVQYAEGYRLYNGSRLALGGFRTNSASKIKDNRWYRMVSNLYNKIPLTMEVENSSGAPVTITGLGEMVWEPGGANFVAYNANRIPALEMFLYEETVVEYTKSITARTNGVGPAVLFARWNGISSVLGYETVPVLNTTELLNSKMTAHGPAPRGHNFVFASINLQSYTGANTTAVVNALALGIKICN